jgi:glycosyltransferase involved in cell wall biosynthesis
MHPYIVVLSDAILQESYLSGAPRRLMELVEGMLQRGWNVAIFDSGKRGARIMFPRYLGSLQEIMMLFLKLVMQRARPHAIVFSSPLQGVAATLYRLFHKNTRIIYCHWGSAAKGIQFSRTENTSESVLKFLDLSFVHLIEKIVCSNSDRLIFDSHAGYMETEELVGKRLAKADVILNNANPSWVQSWLAETRNLSTADNSMIESWKGMRVVGFVGNLYEAGNGLDVLLDALRLAAKRIPKLVLVIVGDGPDRRVLQQKVNALNLQDMISFTGGVPNPLIYVSRFHLFVHPARHHSFPNAILESLACGVPVIGSKVGGIPEILRTTELLFTAGDGHELAGKIMRFFLDKPYRKKVTGLALQLKNEHSFDWQKEMCSTIADTIKS